MFKAVSYYLASYVNYDTKYFLLSYSDRAKINDYHSKIAQQYDIAERISIIISGHLILNNRADLLQDNETIKLANNVISSLYLINNILTHNTPDLADLFTWMGQQYEYETYTVPGYTPYILYGDSINLSLISALIGRQLFKDTQYVTHNFTDNVDNTHNLTDQVDLTNFKITQNKKNDKHPFAPYPVLYTSYEIISLSQLNPEQIRQEVHKMMAFQYDWILYTRNINYIVSCMVKACKF